MTNYNMFKSQKYNAFKSASPATNVLNAWLPIVSVMSMSHQNSKFCTPPFLLKLTKWQTTN
jgi:hypothetical protein